MTAAKAERTGIVTTRPLIARPGVWLTWFVVIFFFVLRQQAAKRVDRKRTEVLHPQHR